MTGGNEVFWSCEVGTGGANLYGAEPNPDNNCSPLQLRIKQQCTFNPSIPACQPPPSGPTCFAIDNTVTLPDGKLRYNYGPGAIDVTFEIINYHLNVSYSQYKCYIASDAQLVCNNQARTNYDHQFSIINNELAYKGNTVWYLCNSAGAGSNIYATLLNTSTSCSSTTHGYILWWFRRASSSWQQSDYKLCQPSVQYQQECCKLYKLSFQRS